METMKLQKQVPVSAMLDPKIVVPAIGSAFVKLDPRLMIKNPVMFVVEVVAALTTIIFVPLFVINYFWHRRRMRTARSATACMRAAACSVTSLRRCTST